jgi:2,5-diketo-D-gluconate reductase A
MVVQPEIRLNDGRTIPQFGLGVWQTPLEQTAEVVAEALNLGYRSIDTAAAYRNEAGVGEGFRRSGLARDEVFITTKLMAHGYDAAMASIDQSLGLLKLDFVDLYLIHWPAPTRDLYVPTWKALIKMREEGRVKSIGVSNFQPSHLKRVIDETGVTPAVNQIELHPSLQQLNLRPIHAELGIAIESWSPLAQGTSFEDPTIVEIARKHGKTPAQAILRWHLDSGLIVIPKTISAKRLRENFDVFDFKLDADDLAAIAKLDRNNRLGPDPDTANF